MAMLMYCSNCKSSKECTKKGTNAAGEQLYFCKTCKKTFKAITDPNTKAKKTSGTKSTIKTSTKEVKGTTKIAINNNTIKTVSGHLTIDEAFDMVSSYFKEIVKEKVEISEYNNEKIIKFKIVAGSKN